jgi:formylglycine-generating enzyme required for sulfatase activity
MSSVETRWSTGAMAVALAAWLCAIAGLGSGCSDTSGPNKPPESTPPKFILIPAGSFTMGDGVAECGVDERSVTLTRDFYLGRCEVTNQEYMEALQWAYDHGYVTATDSTVRDNLDGSTQELVDLDATGCDITFTDGVFSLRVLLDMSYPNHPMEEVTWYGAARYCDWLSLQQDPALARAYEHTGDWSCNGGDPYGAEGYRLPTDAEWEYAAQYDDERIYPWGNEDPSCTRANFSSGFPGCVGGTSPVRSYPAGESALGLSDMAGNVLECCNDWWSCDLGESPATDPVGAGSGPYRVMHGGSYNSSANGMRCASRPTQAAPEMSDAQLGFRVARTSSP